MHVYSAPSFKLSKLPDPIGIPFEGIKDAEIPGRRKVANLIDDFITKSENGKTIQVCLIRAEWGEGKTDAYDRYITKKLKNQFCFPVSTSTVCNRLRNIKKNTTLGNTAVNFLAALFTGLGDDHYSLIGKKNDFFADQVQDPVKYLNEKLDLLFKNNKKLCFIFLDEFEEILENTDVKPDIISGIKEIINKKFGLLCDRGKFAGRLHLFVACTPHAWTIITEDPDLRLLMGGTEQRLAYNLIDLPLLSKDDCYHFLTDLTRVTYEGKLKQLPIASAGVFETIINISQKNPRALIQLFYKLMSKTEKLTNFKVKCIDFEQIFKNLSDFELFVYGSSTPAIEKSTVEKLEASLISRRSEDKNFIKLFEFLIAEHTPFSLQEISERMGINANQVTNYINQINMYLQQDANIEIGIETYLPLKNGRTFESLLSKFDIIDEGTETSVIVISGAKIKTNTIKDVSTNYKLISAESKSTEFFEKKILFPMRPTSLSNILKIDSTIAQTILNIIRNDLDLNNKYYKVSGELIENIFPSPNLIKFDFIEDRSQRLDLRRRIQKDVGDLQNRELLHNNLTKAIIDSLEFSNIKCKPADNYWILEIKLDTKVIPIPVHIEAIFENITKEKIKSLIELVDKTPAILTLLFYTSLLDENIQKDLESLGEIQRIPMDKIIAEQLLVWKKAKESNISINPSSERSRISSAVRELKIEQYLEEIWIRKAIDSGIIIPNLKELGDYGKGDIKPIIASFVSTANLSLSKQWEFYQKLLSIKLFSEKSSFAPSDIEKQPTWNSWALGLETNQFITGINDKVQLNFSPVERRILTLIKNGRNSLQQIEKEFVRLSEAKNPLRNYYVDTLIQKGKIRENSGNLFIISKDDPEITSKIAAIENYVNHDYQNYHKNDRFVSQTKEREARVIAESDYIEIIKELLETRRKIPQNELNIQVQEDEFLRISRLIINIYDYYYEKFLPIVNNSESATTALYQQGKSILNDFKIKVKKIVVKSNSYFKNGSHYIKEDNLHNADAEFSQYIEKIFQQNFDKDSIYLETEKIWKKFPDKKSPFYFEQDLSDAYYFSLKNYQLSNSLYQFKNFLEPLQKIVDKTLSHITQIEESERNIRSKSATYKFSDNHKISKFLLEVTSKYNPPYPESITIKRLSDLEDFFSSISSRLANFSGDMLEILNDLKQLDDKEENFLKLSEKCKNRIGKLDNFFSDMLTSQSVDEDSEGLQTKIKRINNDYTEIKNEFSTLSNSIKNPFATLRDFVKRVSETKSKMIELEKRLNIIEQNSNEIIDSMKEYIENEARSVINFVKISIKPLPQIKYSELDSKRIEFEKFINKLKVRIEECR